MVTYSLVFRKLFFSTFWIGFAQCALISSSYSQYRDALYMSPIHNSISNVAIWAHKLLQAIPTPIALFPPAVHRKLNTFRMKAHPSLRIRYIVCITVSEFSTFGENFLSLINIPIRVAASPNRMMSIIIRKGTNTTSSPSPRIDEM